MTQGFSKLSVVRIWTVGLAAGVTALVALAVGASVYVAPVAFNTDGQFAELREISLQDVGADDDQGLTELQGRLDQMRSDLSPALEITRWAGRLSPALAWIPGLSQEVEAWGYVAARADRDIDHGSVLLSQASGLAGLYNDAEDILVRPGSGDSLSRLDAETSELRSELDALLTKIVEASDSDSPRRPTFDFPILRSLLETVDEAETELALTVRLGRDAADLMTVLLDIAGETQPLIEQFDLETGTQSPLSIDDLRRIVGRLDQDLQFALVKSEGLAAQTARSSQGESLVQKLTLLQDFLTVLLTVNRATLVGLQVVGPALDEARGTEGGILGSGGVLPAVLGLVDDNRGLIDGAVGQLDLALLTLQNIRANNGNSAVRSGLDDLERTVNILSGGLRVVRDIAPVGAELVGVGSTRRYLVLGQSSDELRATSGFVSSVWLVTFEDGALSDVEYFDSVRVDDWERLDLYPPAPEGLEDHMNAHVWLLRDVSWEPDFPTTARTAADMFTIGQRRTVDGVIAVNQWTLLALVQALGSIPAPGSNEEITSRNLLSKLEEETDDHGRAYVDLAMQGVLESLKGPMTLGRLIKVAAAGYDALSERDLLVYSDDPDVQAVISENNWDGRVQRDGLDYLYVVDSNVGWSKSDRNIERFVKYRVDLTRETGTRINLILGYNNHSGPGSPGCEPQWLNRGTNYSALKNACYWNFWRTYVPRGSRLLGNSPEALPEYSVAAEIGKGRPGEDTVEVSSSFNRTIVSGLFAVAAGKSHEVALVYDLPSTLEFKNGESIRYELLVQKQPGTRGRDVTVELVVPEGYSLTESSVPVSTEQESVFSFTLEVNQDVNLVAVFSKGETVG